MTLRVLRAGISNGMRSDQFSIQSRRSSVINQRLKVMPVAEFSQRGGKFVVFLESAFLHNNVASLGNFI